MNTQHEDEFHEPTPARSEGPSHAGGVVYRHTGDRVEYLLVQANRAPTEWVLPKGHIEPGEHVEEAALREVQEESGVLARIKGELPRIKLNVKGNPIEVQFYLMETVAEGKPSDKGREHIWLPLAPALERASHGQTRELLKEAERTRLTE